MAEPFGIVSGAVGIASALSACMDGIKAIQIGRRFGSDFQTFQLRLRMLELRLARWGEALRVHDDPQFNDSAAATDEIRAAKEALFQILELLQKSDKLSKKFRPSGERDDDPSSGETTELDRNILSLDRNIQDIIARRKQKNKVSGVKIARWVLYSRDHALQLIEDITSLIDLLQQLFPMPEKELALAVEEVKQLSSAIVDQQSTIRYLQLSVQGIDESFKKAIGSLETQGHRYGDQYMEENARVQNGHTFTQGWGRSSGPVPVGPSMTFAYQRAAGFSRIRNGDVYVEKDDFWS
ncbi:uncharacterized protein GGS22DRAFT_167265 [Annulohypoxylon maeteangense]|uniref:uncharacterized protein n=1 Tax=Annulohypoxylon maeteangense TaxID=1927788 RepID=UPI002007ADB2|nr:uncharacterized protein GGS22DRAFT_167265 [Annulohypoxylon maeteangense]KAI0883533.1 hypothetical protein GGS22DRAFT_167265 [Annulohypoxylon maeteangense]